MTAQMQTHIREVNSMFADELKKVRERYKEYDISVTMPSGSFGSSLRLAYLWLLEV